MICGNGEIGDPSFGALVKDFRPSLSTIDGLVDAALVVGTVRVPKRSDVDNVCIPRIDDDPADLTGVAQADVLPALAAVGGTVHSVAGGEVGANVGFSGADVNDFWIGGSDGNRSYRSNGWVVKDGCPGYAGIRSLPDAAVDCAEVKGVRIARDSSSGDGAASAEGTNEAPPEAAEKVRRDRLRAQRSNSEAKNNQKR